MQITIKKITNDDITSHARPPKPANRLPNTEPGSAYSAMFPPAAIEFVAISLIGKDGNEEITVEEIAALAGTFNYEFVCDLNKRIPRNYYYNGRYIGSHDYFHEKWNLEI